MRPRPKKALTLRAGRRATVVATLAVLAVILAPAGSASAPSSGIKLYSMCLQGPSDTTANFCAGGSNQSHLTAGSSQQMTLTITNDPTTTQTLGSMNFDAPPGLPITSATAQVSPAGSVTYVANGGVNGTGELQVRNLNLAAGNSAVVTFTVNGPCAGGPFTWPTPVTRQSNSFSGGSSGNDYQSPTSFAGGQSVLSGSGCYLGFVNQPAETQVSPPTNLITDAIGSTGNAIKVGLYGGDGNLLTSCPAGSDCKVSLTVNSHSTDAGTLNGGGPISLAPDAGPGSGLTATFGSLSISGVTSFPDTFTLKATSTFTAPAPAGQDISHSFDIAYSITNCTAGCRVNNLPLGKKGDSLLGISTTSNYGFLTVNPTPAPSSVPDGCLNFQTIGAAGFVETDQRQSDGAMTITYYVPMSLIQAKYGKNVGQQVIPVCAGFKPFSAGAAQDCNTTPDVSGWTDDQLDGSGAFNGVFDNARCAADGYYWGILPSRQDTQKMTAAQLATLGPVVQSWSSGTINGTNYRAIVITVPADWDARGGC